MEPHYWILIKTTSGPCLSARLLNRASCEDSFPGPELYVYTRVAPEKIAEPGSGALIASSWGDSRQRPKQVNVHWFVFAVLRRR